ncbi:unnamed protein product [Rotaria sp. Silwood2]|nr:unnamed protein product [Rotaria sp. Silwood2]
MNISPVLNVHDVIELDSSPHSKDIQQTTSISSDLSNVPRTFLHLSAENIISNLKFNKKNCYTSSTRNMNKHMELCDAYNPKQTHLATSTAFNTLQLINTSISSNTSSSSSIFSSLNNKNLEQHKQKMTNLLSEWICTNIRPLGVVEDTGFKKIVKEAIRIGYTCGPIKSDAILSSRRTVTRQIKSTATSGHEQIKEILLKAARERSLALSPDIWSDAYRQQSYLGCTAHWVDDTWNLYSFEIFCIPFDTPNKKAPDVLKVLKKGLSLYDLTLYMRDIIWVTDRGSNIKKILEEYEVVFCAAHRVNNILERLFFQSKKKKKKKKNVQLHDECQEDNEEKMSDSEESSEDYDDNAMDLQQHQPTNQRR